MTDSEKKSPELNLSNEFKDFTAFQMQKVQKLVSADFPNSIYSANVIKIKNEMYSFFQKKIITLIVLNLARNDVNRITELLKLLNEINMQILSKENILLEIINKIYKNIDSEHNNFVFTSKKILSENENLKNIIQEKSKENMILAQDRQILQEKCSILNNENLFMSSKLLNPNQSKNSTIHIEEEKKVTRNLKSRAPKKITKKLDTELIKVKPDSNRAFSQESLLEMINEIYKSKQLANQKCIEAKHPLQTMEQHMFTFLNQKYGLKSLAVEIASCIIKGIKEFSPINNEICLFALILRNELEEKSAEIAKKTKEVIREQLFNLLLEQTPYKTYDAAQSACNNMQNGFIDEELWLKIVSKLFHKDPRNAQEITNQIYKFINKILKKNASFIDERRVSREEKKLIDKVKIYQRKISYNDFVNIIIGFHLRLRNIYLSNFKRAFKNCDRDNDGVLTKEEFYKLIIDLKIFKNDANLEKNIDDLCLKIRPCEDYNSFSFNQIIELLENEKMIKKHSQDVSLLDLTA